MYALESRREKNDMQKNLQMPERESDKLWTKSTKPIDARSLSFVTPDYHDVFEP